MAIAYSAAVRNAMLDAITAQIGASGKLAIYNGTRPSTGGTATTKLAELTCNATFAPAASGGVLTLNAITQDPTADFTGTATWGRLTTSGGTFIADFNVGTSGSDLNLNTTSIVATGPVSVTSFTITDPNS